MKVIKGFLLVAVISIMAVSCKKATKEDGSSEVTNQVNEATEVIDKAADKIEAAAEKTAETAAATEKTVSATTSSEGKEKAIVAPEKGLDLPTGVILESNAETPVTYPGCTGTDEEIRACSLEKIKESLTKTFDKDLHSRFKLAPGDYKIRTILKVDEAGKVSVVRVDGSNERVQKEVTRMIDGIPQLKPATEAGKAVTVYYVVPFLLKVD